MKFAEPLIAAMAQSNVGLQAVLDRSPKALDSCTAW